MNIDVLTLFPELFEPFLSTSIIGRAQKNKLIEIRTHQLRNWAQDKYKTVDDAPYGGGPGMVLKVDVIDHTLHDLKSNLKNQKSKIQVKSQKDIKPYIILLTPQGKPFIQSDAQRLAKKRHLILVAGHYEGFDERVRALVDEEISIGDYVLTGGELPAMVVIDAVSRLLPGVLGKDESSSIESFTKSEINNSEIRNLLEYPQYTRPESYLPVSIQRKRPLTVPTILRSGHHASIEKWRLEQAEGRTRHRRPDLIG